ncbi:hypothetical protein ACFV9C_42470 [Kribbella sp. NPDC059898]|uniref:hypothetical protein n=1 Tax=Kribbella sp. NPDC059898 TaxID=3346995 RepID=UPI00364DBAA4
MSSLRADLEALCARMDAEALDSEDYLPVVSRRRLQQILDDNPVDAGAPTCHRCGTATRPDDTYQRTDGTTYHRGACPETADAAAAYLDAPGGIEAAVDVACRTMYGPDAWEQMHGSERETKRSWMRFAIQAAEPLLTRA